MSPLAWERGTKKNSQDVALHPTLQVTYFFLPASGVLTKYTQKLEEAWQILLSSHDGSVLQLTHPPSQAVLSSLPDLPDLMHYARIEVAAVEATIAKVKNYDPEWPGPMWEASGKRLQDDFASFGVLRDIFIQIYSLIQPHKHGRKVPERRPNSSPELLGHLEQFVLHLHTQLCTNTTAEVQTGSGPGESISTDQPVDIEQGLMGEEQTCNTSSCFRE